jgi:hypothetical protein
MVTTDQNRANIRLVPISRNPHPALNLIIKYRNLRLSDLHNRRKLSPDNLRTGKETTVSEEITANGRTELIGGLFIPPDMQLHVVRQRNLKRNWRFTDDDFRLLGEPPPWPGRNLYAVVLDVTLDTVPQTFEEAWNLAAVVQRSAWCWHQLKADSNHLRLLPGVRHHRGLRWVIIDLGANWEQKTGISPADVRSPQTSPASALLWAASYFPRWPQAMDGINVPYVWIPGYQLTTADLGAWELVPFLGWYRLCHAVTLSGIYARHRHNGWAVPELRQ